ncbi:hypothetical protein FNF29_03844 [Cafeteria roenbergensis]|uniref:Aminopeptidase N n=1 Tax=Cafeteria roenbergensis TaxID=33653 RepID=A0A5A8CJI6_CAFRO|nr:hypothetical protein FNF29_03844 [Cafeteria roenbergensis]KAA0165233.1 hypothetical protein FNF28_03514 [Cafeteria roenbergensis]|eukprot:KAA0152617.1 hypothetical protein FNF29_03844 [Cafeteria roenbergensis]
MASDAAAAPKETMRRDYVPPAFLAPKLDIFVRLSADGKDVTVGARTTFAANPEYIARTGMAAGAVPALQLDVDLKHVDVQAVRVNGKEIPADAVTKDEATSTLTVSAAALAEAAPEALAGGEFVVETVNKQNPVENLALEGLYMSQGDYCTQMEAEGFRRFVPHLDRPDVLSLFSTTIEAPTGYFNELLSNGNRMGGGDGAAPAEFLTAGVDAAASSDGIQWARWEHPVPKPAYLFALVAGKLSSIDDTFTTRSGRSVALRMLAKEADIPKCHWAVASLKRAMEWDELRYGREYDLDIFHIVAVASFSMGAMENSSLNVFNIKYVLADESTATDTDFDNVQAVVGHEYFHNWSGNRVTCRDWFQLSLKEGFTVFRDQEFTSDLASRPIKRISDVDILRAYQFAEAGGPMSHPVRPASFVTINNFYSVTVYNGGAEVVRMYPSILGRGAFRRGTDLYFERHDGQAVTCDHFCTALEDANWKDLPAPDAAADSSPFKEGEEVWVDPPFQRCGERPLTQFRRWYSVAGTPEVAVSVTHDAAARTVTVKMTQSVPPTTGQEGAKPPLHIPVAFGLLGADGADLPLKLRADPASWDQRFGATLNPVEAGAPEAGRDAEMFPGSTVMLHLTQPEQTFVFEDVDFPAPAEGAVTSAGLPVPSAPVPSVLRGFSSPVRLALEGDDAAARLFRLAHDADPFNRFEASNLLATDLITALVPSARPGAAGAAAPDSSEAPALTAGAGEAATEAFCDAIGHMLRSATATAAGTSSGPDAVDPALVAHVLALPPYKSLVQACAKRDGGVADPRAVIAARSALRRALAKHLATELVDAFNVCTEALSASAAAAASSAAEASAAGESPLMSKENKARRALRNAALGLLVAPLARASSDAARAAGADAASAAAAATAVPEGAFDLVAAAKKQAASATNMTDEFGALRAILSLATEHPDRAAAADAFYAKWKGQSLVEDKWLSALAVTSDAAAVRALMKHEAFDLMVPNKVYSLVRTFTEGNPEEFHHASGAGYDLLADVVAELERANPQVAARIATSFTAGRSLPRGLAAAMKERVDRVLEGASTKDVREVLGRCQAALVAALAE